jgi:hypothetical protein
MKLSDEIVRAMQQLAVEQRALVGVRAPWHVGDIAWGLRQHEDRENEWKIRIWIEAGHVVAWSWLKQDGRDRLEHDVHPEHEHLLDEILDEPVARSAFAFHDDDARRFALARHGFTEAGSVLDYLARELSAAPDVPKVPEGYVCRTVRDSDESERVAIHQDGWRRPGVPSKFSASSYAQLRNTWPYRASLDCVVDAGWTAGGLLSWLARRCEPGGGVRTGRHSRRVPRARAGRSGVPFHPPASAWGGSAKGDRLHN